MDINSRTNNLSIIGKIKFNSVIYFFDKNRNVYINSNNSYSKVTDEKLIKQILEYITPKSIDIKN